MPTVGRTLAAERIRQGLALEDVAAITKVSTRWLRAIEADDFEQLPGLIFARNFVRQYAEVLHVDTESIVDQFNREQIIASPPDTHQRAPKTVPLPRLSPGLWSGILRSNLVSAFVTFVLTIGICTGLYYAYRSIRARGGPRVSVTVPPPSNKRPVQKPAVQPSAKATTPTAVATASPPAATTVDLDSPLIASSAAAVKVEISANDSCWTRVTADGKVLFAGVLKPGETRDIRAATSVTLRVGNAGALSVKLNGAEVQPIGPKGQVRIVDLTAAGAQVKTPQIVLE